MNQQFLEAIEALERERHMSKEKLIQTIELALKNAYKKHYGGENSQNIKDQNIRVSIDMETGDINVFMSLEVVEDVENPYAQISVAEAKEADPEYEVGDILEYQVTPSDFGRVAALAAKQVVVQSIREAERNMIYDEYISRQGELVSGIVQRVTSKGVYINIGRAEGILEPNEQIKTEKYEVNQRLKVYVMDIKKNSKGPQMLFSRTHPLLVKKLFELEVPELKENIIEIKSVSRESGSRSKISVFSNDPNVDPVGSCVGNRGIRVQAVVDELGGENIDIIPWDENPGIFIKNALAPAKVEMVLINEEEKSSTVIVPDHQLSLAIGKSGQNVRLAAKLCNWKIDIKSHSQYYSEGNDIPQNGETVIEKTQNAEFFKSMEKTKLIEFAQKNGIEIDPKAANSAIIETILKAMEEK